ncbi:nucleolar protein 14 [Leptodactylus fuscus]|uniref:nucleolar protein 14 n=1 Tax=Leptodactylus fuscus TaxID=238119 RepID=UPI003F4F03C2
MGKNNKKKGKKPPAGPAGRVSKARSEVRDNPFEVKINKQKFTVLGRKTKHDVGLPGVSKSKALKKRKDTLLREYQQRGKSSVFSDKRFGEYDTKLTPEEKMMKRFALERQKHVDKKTMYNLNEEEELTHYGQSLATLEKMTDAVDSDSDTEERGALSAELTAAHFGGGGLLRKKAPSEQTEEEPEKPKSRKELIEELIAKSKIEKRERQSQREKAHELTEKLDSDWKAIQGLMAHKVPKSERKVEPEKPKPDDYDMTVRQLVFDMKAKPSDKMKSEEEIAKEEQERIQRLEADRLRRMRGEDDKTKKSKHISADDLMDGFILDKDDRLMLSYKDGKMNLPESENKNQKAGGDTDNAVDDQSDDDDEEEEDDEEGDSEEGDEDAEEGDEDTEESDEDTEESDEDTEESDEDTEGGDEDTEASDFDIKASDEDNEKNDGKDRSDSSALDELTKKDLKLREKRAMESGSPLPITFNGHQSSFKVFRALLDGKTPDQQVKLVERMIKENHQTLTPESKGKLEDLMNCLVAYIELNAESNVANMEIVDKMIKPLYNLCQSYPELAAESFRETIKANVTNLNEGIKSTGQLMYPRFYLLLNLKLVGILFPTSDFWHPVVTPAMTMMSQILTECTVTHLTDVTSGLFAACASLEYVSLSKRFIPELINFLLGILHLATPPDASADYYVVPLFKRCGKFKKILFIDNPDDAASWVKTNLPLTTMYVIKTKNKTKLNHFRLTCTAVCLDLVKRCVDMYSTLPAFREIFGSIEKVIRNHLPRDTYPEKIQDLCKNILEDIEKHSKKPYSPLSFEKQMPVPMKMFTPKVMPVLEFGKKQGCNKVERERKRLIHKHKREFKGAVREIRRDNQFLAREKLSETMRKDSERKRKVKELFNSLSTQEGEWKAMKRRKMKGK